MIVSLSPTSVSHPRRVCLSLSLAALRWSRHAGFVLLCSYSINAELLLLPPPQPLLLLLCFYFHDRFVIVIVVVVSVCRGVSFFFLGVCFALQSAVCFSSRLQRFYVDTVVRQSPFS